MSDASNTSSESIIGPVSSYYISQRLRLHYVDWGNEDKPPLLLIHGGRDHARSWDWVARALRDDYHVIAPDLRGHGDSDWTVGGSYTLTEFVLDIAQLIHLLDLRDLRIVAHSFGGSLALQYAGIYSDRIKKLLAIEGMGPPTALLEKHFGKPAHEQIDEWIQNVRSFAGRHPRRYPTIDAAAARMQEENSFLSAEQAHHLTVHGVARNEDGTYSWKFDNNTRLLYPASVRLEQRNAMWERITCPTFLVHGTESWAGDPTKDGRSEAIPHAKILGIEQAGHWVHHDQLDRFVDAAREFLAD